MPLRQRSLNLMLLAVVLTLPWADARAQETDDADRTKLQAAVQRGVAFNKEGKWSEAIREYETAAALAPKVFGRDDPNTADLLNNLGLLYFNMGQYARAEPLYQRSLAIREAKLGKDHPATALTLNNLALLYQDTGQLAKAEPLYQRSLAIREAKQGKDHPDMALTLHNLAYLYQGLGQLARAELLYQRSLAIKEANLGKDHPGTALTLNNLGLLYRSMGQYAKAEPLYQRSLAIYEAQLGKDHPDTALTLNNLALLYQDLGQFAKVEPLYQRSLAIKEAKLGKDHPDTALTLNNLAWLYQVMGQYAKAEPLYKRCLAIREAKLGKDHPATAFVLNNLASLYAVTARWAEAIEQVNQARRILARHMASVLPSLTEAEQAAFLRENVVRSFHIALSLGRLQAQDGQAAEASAAWLLNGKGLVHQALAEQQLLARDAQDPKARALVEQLQQTRGTLAALLQRTPKVGQEDAYHQERQELQRREHELARQLAQAVARPFRDDPWVKLSEVRKKLGKDAVLIDIARFPVWDFKGNQWQPARYVAWVTPPEGKGTVRVIDLGAADAIDAAVQSALAAIAHADEKVRDVGEPEALKAISEPFQKLGKLVLHPLAEAIDGYKEWIICPDGALWLVPWAALPLKDGRFAVREHVIRHIISGRDLVVAVPRVQAQAAHLFADPDFDLAPTQVTAQARGLLRGLGRTTVPDGPRSAGLASSLLPKVRRLPGTAAEAAAVQSRLQALTGTEAQMHTGAAASEALLKALRRPRVLVLSTHGYFLPDQEVEPKGKAPLTNTKGQKVENPLLRCGLLLAGCNKRGEAQAGDEDGVLTGLEVVGLDLRGTELVVLSACETGLGEVRNGEGVAGLRQAFQLAGARSVLASLWQVPDRETARLMRDFFGQLAQGKDRAEALRLAQLEMIRSRRERHGTAHPFFWAAFTLTGQGQ